MAIVGPGAINESIEQIGGTLDGASEYEYVTVFNPLPDDFAVRVGQSRPTNVPFPIRQDNSGETSSISHSERDVQQVYGLNLKNKDHPSSQHFSTTIIIKAGQSLNLLGNEAQVAVRQIVNEIMQREGDSKLLADPELRRQAEAQVIKKRSSINELMGQSPVSPQQQAMNALNTSNEAINETEFPGLTAPKGGAEDTTSGNETSEPEAVDSNRTGTVSVPKTAKR